MNRRAAQYYSGGYPNCPKIFAASSRMYQTLRRMPRRSPRRRPRLSAPLASRTLRKCCAPRTQFRAGLSRSPAPLSRCRKGRIFIELINGSFLLQDKGSPAEYGAGMKLSIARGWLKCTRAVHSSGSRQPVGAELFA